MTKRIFLAAFAGLVLGACAQDSAPDFCGDHALFHAEHATQSAKLSVTMTEVGTVESDIEFPAALFDPVRTQDILQDVANVYALQTATACDAADSTVSSNATSIFAKYVSECGADNKPGQVDVSLFDTFPTLEEVEVTVVTPATQKHFLINRQCAAAIFRFQ